MIPPPDLPPSAGESKYNAYVYLIANAKTERFYVGWTTNLDKRIRDHNAGKSFYTRNRGPWKLVHYEGYSNKEQAKMRERKLKKNPHMMECFKKKGYLSLYLDSPPLYGVNQVVG